MPSQHPVDGAFGNRMSDGFFIGALDLADLQHPSLFGLCAELGQQLAFLLDGQVLVASATPTHGSQHLLAFFQVLRLEPSD